MLELRRVCFEAAGRRLVDGVDLRLEPGARTMVLGPNGAGKSLLLRLCHGLIRPSSGEVLVSETRQAMVFQRPVMLRRSARANIEYALALAGLPRRARAAFAIEALRRVGLISIAASPARRLSGGEQQRLALARAWALEPRLLFLDEPTASLDPGSSAEVERIVGAIHAAGTRIVMTTHNLGLARRLADEIVFVHSGRVTEHTPAEQFFNKPASVEAEQFLRGESPWR